MKKEYIHINEKRAIYRASNILLKYLKKTCFKQPIIILCIGTDRSTGDSLGPLVGYKLKNMNYYGVHVIGTLDEPVHAQNLEKTLKYIQKKYKDSFVIAIDASLGKIDHIGYLAIGDGPIKPGAGLDKKLPETGDIHISGIVNLGGIMDFMILQNTRLSVVMKMAETIAKALQYAIWKYRNLSVYTDMMSEYIQ